jgi:amino acid transporter
MFAVANTVLINYVMGSRLLYGMANQGLVPRVLGTIHPKRRTPYVAIGALLGVVLVLAFSGTVAELGAATGLLLLLCFAIVNAALIVLKLRKDEPKGHFEVPIVVPALGIIINVTLIVARLMDEFAAKPVSAASTKPADKVIDFPAPAIAGLLVLAISALYFVMRPKAISEETLARIEEES